MNKTKIFDLAVRAIMISCLLILTADVIYSDIYFLRNSEKFPYEFHILWGVLVFFFLFIISVNKLRLIFTGQPTEKSEPENRNLWEDFFRSLIGITLLDIIENQSNQLSRSGLNGNVNIDAVTMDIITLWLFGIAGYILFYLLWNYFKRR